MCTCWGSEEVCVHVGDVVRDVVKGCSEEVFSQQFCKMLKYAKFNMSFYTDKYLDHLDNLNHLPFSASHLSTLLSFLSAMLGTFLVSFLQ